MNETVGKEWDRWGGKARCLMGYREEIVEAESAVSEALRTYHAESAAFQVTLGIRHLRRAVRELESLRYKLDCDAAGQKSDKGSA